jgi:YidC/Oxa1 family membrane protein insertase
MNIKKLSVLLISAYLIICAALIFNSGIFSRQRDTQKGILTLAAEANLPDSDRLPEIAPLPATAVSKSEITAASAEEKNFILGSVSPAEKNNPYKLELNLTTKGAAVLSAKLRDYDNRDRKNPQSLELLSTINTENTMASTRLLLPDLGKSFPLDRLNWQSTGVLQNSDKSQSISFYAIILKDGGELAKLTKTYTLKPEDYLLACSVTIANLSNSEIKTSLEMLGPAGISKEQERIDTRTITTGFLTPQGTVAVEKLNITKLAKVFGSREGFLIPKNADYKFLWTSLSNKYFTAIIRPVPQEANSLSPQWIQQKTAMEYNPDKTASSGDENAGILLQTTAINLAPGEEQKCDYQLYIGPKDRHLFDSNPLYKKLGFIRVIEFQSCCIQALSFPGISIFILAVMNWMYRFIPNYGIVIIIFVFIVRILLHPITKKSQVSMMKMTKLGPKAEEIKQKYANNKTEMNKQMMGLYKEHGASPVLGCLPMMLQMPIWIALYSALLSGIEFRGAAFLPFWITDLSGVDALFYLPAAVEKIPMIGSFIGTSFNLLPLLLGASMFAQTKLMPSSAPSTNPQAAQQQKMMLWMMPVMMLLLFYRAPSGLNLYIMSSTVAGLVEQYVIRKHIREKEEAQQAGFVPTTSKLGGKLKKKKPKPPIRFS